MRSPAPLLLAACLTLGGLAFATRAPAAGSAVEAGRGREDEARRLRAIQKQIDQEQRAVHAVEKARASLVESLRALDQTLAVAEEARLTAEREALSAEEALASAGAGIARLEEERRGLEARLFERLRALYKFGHVGYVQILFSSKDYQDFARRSRFLGRVVRSDAELIGEYRRRIAALQAERGRLAGTRRALEGRRRTLAAREDEAEGRRGEKALLLSRIEREKDTREEALRDLERSAGALQGVYLRLRQVVPPQEGSTGPKGAAGQGAPGPAKAGAEKGAPPPAAGTAFSVLRGALPLPADGRVIKTFGLHTDPELGTQIRSNGITVRAPYGAPIRAVADGRVLYAGWFRGYGRILIADHGEGYYTLVAHASELLRRVGDSVRAGEEIARVGDSGSLEGPIVYFEIRREGRPLDPREWIRS